MTIRGQATITVRQTENGSRRQFNGKFAFDVRDPEPDRGPYLAPKAKDGAPNVPMIAWGDLGYATINGMAKIAELAIDRSAG